jgi:RNA polymerase sigma-70 factor (ECF subfamily)
MTESADQHGRPLDVLLEQSAWVKALVRRLATGADADDLAQDLALEALERPLEARSARGWLVGTARNLARMTQRGEARRAKRQRAHARGAESTSDAPPTVLERLELQREVTSAVHALAEPYRTTLLLRFLDERSVAEVATETGVVEATVRVRIHRGLTLLRARLGFDQADRRRAFLALVAVPPTTTAPIALLLTMKTLHLGLGAAAIGLVAYFALRTSVASESDPRASAPFVPFATERGRHSISTDVVSAPPRTERTDRAVAPAPAPLTGSVTDASGAPVAGAEVIALANPANWSARGTSTIETSVTTSSEGRFTLPGGVVHVVVLAEDYLPTDLPVPADAPLEITLAPAARIHGQLVGGHQGRTRIVALGTRVEGESVVRGPYDAADGAQYSIPGLPPSGTYTIQVSPDDALTTWIEVELDRPGDHRRDIDLEGIDDVVITVLDDLTENPVSGVRVSTGTYEGVESIGTSDVDGRLQLRLRGSVARWRLGRGDEPAFQMLELLAPGYCRGQASVDRLLRADEPRAYLVQSARIEGIVRHADGTPAEGAVVEWFGSPLFVHGPRTGIIGLPPGSQRTASAADGTFALPDVFWDRPDGSVRVVDEASGLERIAWDASPRAAGDTVAVEVVLPSGPTIDVSIHWNGLSAETWMAHLDPGTWRDSPIPMPRTRIVAIDAMGELHERVVEGDSPATLEGLALGAYTLHAEKADDTSVRSPSTLVELTTEAPCAWRTLQLDLPRRKISGRILAADGGAPGKTSVMALPDWALGPRFAKPSTTGGVTSAADGRFELAFLDLPIERSLLLVLHQDLQLLYEVPSSGPVSPRLPELATLTFEVRDAAGLPFEGSTRIEWSASADSPGGRIHRPRRPGKRGRLEVALPRGICEVSVIAEGDEGLGEVSGRSTRVVIQPEANPIIAVLATR